MSIFDVIKYPISIPPTPEQFERLPHDLFLKWYEQSDWATKGLEFRDRDPMHQYIADWYADFYFVKGYFDECDRIDLQLLKQMIRDYNT